MRPSFGSRAFHGAVVLLGILSLVGAHGHDEDGAAWEVAATAAAAAAAASRPVLLSPSSTGVSQPSLSYFNHPAHGGLLYAHVVFMTVAWVFVLPPALALSIARSRLTLPVQVSFLVIHALGLVTGAVYNGKTPDLYPQNIHHGLGWLLTIVVAGQALLGFIRRYAGLARKGDPEAHEDEPTAFIPVSVEALAEHHRVHGWPPACDTRFSRDSGQGTERTSTSDPSALSSPQDERPDRQLGEWREVDHHEDDHLLEKKLPVQRQRRRSSWISAVTRKISDRIVRIGTVVYNITDRLLLPLGFVGMASGVIVYSGIFHDKHVFNGLAHFVKGGIFVWYGFLTLGRWMGCFADLGWAWNVRPERDVVGTWSAAMPSAEFVESAVIFVYGASNVFLEHLAAWGGAWTAQDLEHVSISIMFFGGGLAGMLVESRRVRDLLNMPIVSSMARSSSPSMMDPPKTYRFSMNPFPALIIILLGIMMGSHYQTSMVSTMVHKQWGMLFVGFALARAVTYVTVYISPPTSVLPSRPPSELVSSFCLLSGGLIFMASNRDTVAAMEKYHLDAMFIFTLTMGVTAFFMAWTMLVVAIKGWAVRRRQQQHLFDTRQQRPGLSRSEALP